ncbi:hypothetical protein JW710_04365 [Candidatus Dojkabacteria bacterium]|nr:hypothetical protein [Candidatus Dojkabacteria bacterium]
MDTKGTKTFIKNILHQNSLRTEQDFELLLRRRLEEKENNIRFEATDSNGKKCIVKVSISHLGNTVQHTGIRAKMNLNNEIRFYNYVKDLKFKDLVIPEFVAGKEGNPAYLIIEKMMPEEYVIFPDDMGYTGDQFPDFFAKSFVSGMHEFQQIKADKEYFLVMSENDIATWLGSMSEVFSDFENAKYQKVVDLFEKYFNLWTNSMDTLSHSDILPDALGYSVNTKKLLLLDFEKVQVSYSSFDFSAMVKSPLMKDWIEDKFEPELFSIYKEEEFRILYNLSKALRLLTGLKNLKTGFIDHVFEAMLGKDKFEKVKPVAMDIDVEMLGRALEEF